MAMFLSLSKSVSNYDKEVRNGDLKNSNKIKTLELLNKNILIAGFGRIGKKLISRCLAFDTKVYVYDPYVEDKIIKDFGGIRVKSISEDLKIADYVSLHMPLTNETKNLINYSILNQMKKMPS